MTKSEPTYFMDDPLGNPVSDIFSPAIIPEKRAKTDV